jgi:hypothetical protein
LFKFWRLQKFPLTSPSGDSELMGPRDVEYIDRAARTERIGAQDKHRPVFQRFIQFLFVFTKLVPTIAFNPKRVATEPFNDGAGMAGSASVMVSVCARP